MHRRTVFRSTMRYAEYPSRVDKKNRATQSSWKKEQMTMEIMSKGGKEGNGSSPVVQPKSSYCHVDSEFRYLLFTLYYSFLFILGVVGNIYVLYIFTWVYSAKKRNEVKIFIINLTVANLLFLVTLPSWIVYYHNAGNWIMSPVLCNVAGYLYFVNTYCSVAFLGVINCNQFRAVIRPNTGNPSSTQKWGVRISKAVWILIAGPGLYYLFKDGTSLETVNGRFLLRCFERYDINSDTRPIFAIHVVIFIGFFVIFFAVLVCDAFILRSWLSGTVHDEETELTRKKALWLVCAILAVFVICFVPHHIVDIPWTMVVLGRLQHWSCQSQNLVNNIHQVTLTLLNANCIFDPIIYCFLTMKFRKEF
ncbi:hypothetical protein lerEdw1_009886 [Lerista edwardsae]|nr:hypothetical protein lerEdw1_009886 [Lerista edwardsae]